MKKSTKIVRTVLQVLVSLSFLAGGFSKLMGSASQMQMFSALHIESTLMIIGVLEVLVVIGLWFKKTRTLAILFITAIMGAAIAETISMSMGINMQIVAPGIIMLMAWGILWIDMCGCACGCEGCKDCMAKKDMQTPAPTPTA